MERQQKRKVALIVSMLSFPVVMYYLSPVLIIGGAAQGTVTGIMFVFASFFLLSLYFGRAYCGWICSPGGLQAACQFAQNKPAKTGKRDRIKFFIWYPWLGIIAIASLFAGGFSSIDLLFMTEHGVSISSPEAYFTYYLFVGIIVALSFISGRRAFCHYGCWMAPFMIYGTKARDTLKLPGLRLKAEKEKCNSCKLCTKNCPMSLDVNQMVLSGSMRNYECILCGSCVDICPKDAIAFSKR